MVAHINYVSLFHASELHFIGSHAFMSEPGTTYIVTTYQLLVLATVFTFGMLNAGLTYSGISTGANWIEWTLGVVITSVCVTKLCRSTFCWDLMAENIACTSLDYMKMMPPICGRHSLERTVLT